MKIKVDDLSRSKLLDSDYDLAFFSLGYEPRCVYVPSILDKARIDDCVIFSYSENQDNENRLKSYEYFESDWGSEKINELSHSCVKKVYKCLSDKLENIESETVKILIDYSSMSRNWYSSILNYLLKFYNKEIIVDLVYSNAEYPITEEFLNFELGDIKILPGCEGSSITKRKKAAIFMLGFDRLGPQSFYNLLEPEISFGVIASPGSLPDYDTKAIEINKDFIDHQLDDRKNLLRLPISSLSVTFENLCQVVQPLKAEYNISIIQFGPKPHIIAATLAGIFFENVSCIYSEYNRTKTFNVVANGELVITRITTKR